ncbi:MAG: hypothetical protein HY438_04410 [DPANN group archaeon]|nr:hypothetical protein [DPANN group archaeon]
MVLGQDKLDKIYNWREDGLNLFMIALHKEDSEGLTHSLMIFMPAIQEGLTVSTIRRWNAT